MKANSGPVHHSTLLTSKQFKMPGPFHKKRRNGGWARKWMYLSDLNCVYHVDVCNLQRGVL